MGARKRAPSKAWKPPGCRRPRRPPITSSGQRLSWPKSMPVAQWVTAGPAETMTAERNPPET